MDSQTRQQIQLFIISEYQPFTSFLQSIFFSKFTMGSIGATELPLHIRVKELFEKSQKSSTFDSTSRRELLDVAQRIVHELETPMEAIYRMVIVQVPNSHELGPSYINV